MIDFLIDLCIAVSYDILILCFVWLIARNLIHYWSMQRAVMQNFVDTEMMKIQLNFQKSLRELDSASSVPENMQ